MKDGGSISLAFKALTDAELKEQERYIPVCFICGYRACGAANYWYCERHAGMTIEDALKEKMPHA